MLTGRTVERDLHQEFAQGVGAWRSWSSGPWLTDGSVLIKTMLPPEKPCRMELTCNCPPEKRDQDHFVEANRSCVYIDVYEEDNHVREHIEYVLNEGLSAPLETLTVPAERIMDEAIIDSCPYPFRQVSVRGGAGWMAIQDRHIHQIEDTAAPDTWEYREFTPKGISYTIPMLVGSRRGQVVGMAPVLPIKNSIYDGDQHTKVLTAYMKQSHDEVCDKDHDHSHGENPINSLLDMVKGLARDMGMKGEPSQLSESDRDADLERLSDLMQKFLVDHKERKENEEE